LDCATQNELAVEDAVRLIDNGVICVAEGANMPSVTAAVKLFEDRGVLFGPGRLATPRALRHPA
jgi:glutamate dehydrogenase (NADP+)